VPRPEGSGERPPAPGHHLGAAGEPIQEVAAALTRMLATLSGAAFDTTVLETSLREATAGAAKLNEHLAAIRETLAVYREIDRWFSRLIERAESQAAEVIRAARTEAEEVVRSARRAAGQIAATARQDAVQTLRAARTCAEGAIAAAEKVAEQRLALARIEADWTRNPGRLEGGELRLREEDLSPEWRQAAGLLEAFVASLADLLRVMQRLRTQLTQLDQAAAEESPHPAPRAESAAPPSLTRGEVVASPFHSYLELTKFLIGLSALPGVKTARAASFESGTATIEVTLEGTTAADLDVGCLAEQRVDVVESSPTRLVLRVLEGGG
jgi:hypothetical protein